MTDSLKSIITSLLICGMCTCGFVSCDDDADSTDHNMPSVTTTVAEAGVKLENVTFYRKRGASDDTYTTYNYYIDRNGKELRIYNPYMLNLDGVFDSNLQSEAKVNALGDVVLMQLSNSSSTSSAETLFKILSIEKAK